ncbi:MAG: aldo/keto reductase [Acidimicrobiales bacterium]
MEQRQLGHSGLTVSALGLGCNNLGPQMGADRVEAVVHEALEGGITLFDTAEAYGDGASEEMLGAALGKHRDEAVLATWPAPRDGSASSLARSNGACSSEESRRRSCRPAGTSGWVSCPTSPWHRVS